MSPRSPGASLRAVPGFEGLAADHKEQLCALAPMKRFEAGSLLCEAGARAEECFLIIAGDVEILRSPAPRARVLATLRAGDFVGQLGLVDDSARTPTVRASTPVVALRFSRAAFMNLTTTHGVLALYFQKQVAVATVRQLRGAMRRLELLLEPRSTALSG